MTVQITDDQLAAFEGEVRRVAVRDAAGWEVSFRRKDAQSHPLDVNLEHPLSPGFGWHPTREQVEAIDTTMLQEIIDREPDFEHIAQAPACQHEDVVRGLRDLAGMFYWRQSEVSTLAGMLANAGCLTSDEYEWLARYAGREHRRAAAIQLNVFGRSDSEPDTPPT